MDNRDPLSDMSFLHDIPIELCVQLGQARLTVRELADLSTDDVIELDRLANQPLDLLVGGQVFARGEVVVVEGRVALRVTELVGRPQLVKEAL